MENVYGVYTDYYLLAKFFQPIAFTCMVRQNFPPPNISRVRYFIVHNLYMHGDAHVMVHFYYRLLSRPNKLASQQLLKCLKASRFIETPTSI